MNGSRFDRLPVWAALAIICALLLSSLTAHSEDTPVTDPIFEYSYTTNVVADNAFFKLYVNGAPMAQHLRLQDRVLTVPVETALQHGTNQLVVDVEPFDLTAQAFKPHDGFYLQINLARLRGAPVATSTLLTLAYSEAEGRFVQQSDQSSDEDLANVTDVTIEDTLISYSNRVSEDSARRITITFTLDDTTLTEVPWAKATALADTTATRSALHEAAGKLHQAYQTQDAQLWQSMIAPHIERLGRARGYESTAELATAILKLSPLTGPEGSTLMPLLSASEAATAPLQTGSDNRLITFRASPIRFQIPGEEFPQSVVVFFCDLPEGMFVCHTQMLTF